MTHARIQEIDRELAQAKQRLNRYEQAAGVQVRYADEARVFIDKLTAERKALTNRPEPSASIVTFVKQFGQKRGRSFHYAAISFTHESKPGQRFWSVTGKANINTVPWSVVADFIDRDETEATKPAVVECIPNVVGPALARFKDQVAKAFGVPVDMVQEHVDLTGPQEARVTVNPFKAAPLFGGYPGLYGH